MSIINVEEYDYTKDYINTIYKEASIIDDYFNFELNDVELSSLLKILREGKNSKLLTECDLKSNLINIEKDDAINIDAYMQSYKLKEKVVYENFNEIYSQIIDSFFNLTSYPYYKNTIYESLRYRIQEYKNNEYNQIYFFILFQSKRKQISGKIFEYYRKKFIGNFESSTNNLRGQQQQATLNSLFPCINNLDNLPNAASITSTLTIDILKTQKFKEFCNELAKWYSLAEVITVNLGILNEFFGFKLEFFQEKFSLNNNYGFSLETFAKKNILKLISYSLNKLTLNLNFSDFNYKRLLLIVASAFTCGIPLKDFFFRDIKQFAIIVSISLISLLVCFFVYTIYLFV